MRCPILGALFQYIIGRLEIATRARTKALRNIAGQVFWNFKAVHAVIIVVSS